ncbi:MAG: hypothetical protein WC838_03810, partial [Candidatus Margulisiibacteriota bacterium]
MLLTTAFAGFLPVREQVSAGSLAEELNAYVAGYPASWDTVMDSVRLAIRRKVVLQPGADVIVEMTKIVPQGPLGEGRRTLVIVPYTISGAQYSSVSGIARVEVENEVVANIEPGRLFVSNNPEEIMGPGILFKAELVAEQAVRFLYYHKTKQHKYDLSCIISNDDQR